MVFHHILVLKSKNDIVGVNCNVLGTQKIHDNVQRAQKKHNSVRSYLKTVDSKKKSLTSNITVVLVTCVVVIGVILSIMSSSFSVEWIVFLTFMSGNHSDQSRITGECDPTKHFSLPVFFIPFNLWSCTDLKWSATVLLMVKGKMDSAEVFYDFVTSQSR